MTYQKKQAETMEVGCSGFGGLDRTSPLCGGEGSFELRNLRREEDGSLTKRGGLRPLVTLPAKVRRATGLCRNGQWEYYAVAGETVYALTPFAGGFWQAVPLGTLASQDGPVEFVAYGGAVLLPDGGTLWCLTPDSMTAAQTYIPLYGRDWDPQASAERPVYQAPNLLSRRLRIRFAPTAETATYDLGLAPASVDRVEINGAEYQGTVTYDALTGRVTLADTCGTGDRIEIYLTMPAAQQDTGAVLSCPCMTAIGPAEAARMLFYGAPGEGRVWISRPVEAEEANALQDAYLGTCMLYVTEADALTVGDGIHPVTGACRHYDRSLIFTTQGTWMADDTDGREEAYSLVPVNTTLGCSLAGGAVSVGNDPITVFGTRVLRWTGDTDRRDECNAKTVSDAVEPLLPSDFGQATAVFGDGARGEVWFYRPGEPERILVYQSRQSRWTSFDGLAPQCMLAMERGIGLAMDATVYLLDDTAAADTVVTYDAPGGQTVPIEAEVKTCYLDLGAPHRDKRMCGMTLIAESGWGELTVMLENVDGRRRTLVLPGDGMPVTIQRRRWSVGRSRFFRVAIRSTANEPLRLYGFHLRARCLAR